MRRVTAIASLLGAIALATALSAAAAGKSGSLRIVEAGGARFPDRAFVLTLPAKERLQPARLHVLENGARVSNVTLVPVGTADRGDFGVVLVIDASNSMHGAAIADAMEAARAFAARRPANQQLAVVTFNETSSVLLPFTSDEATIDAALATPPPLAKGTHVYDGVATALTLLRTAKIASGSIVVLSDGADTGSRLSATEAAASARQGHVRIFSVGIRSKSFRSCSARAARPRGRRRLLGGVLDRRPDTHLRPARRSSRRRVPGAVPVDCGTEREDPCRDPGRRDSRGRHRRLRHPSATRGPGPSLSSGRSWRPSGCRL